ncbi:uncharacterized protein LOC116426979 [Nomia melanderi]|uniref:uncharacterized protein LOC116426979 n=1 Tax=Nomia melanderi TaxID=2448451 RepID=UPI0013040794|nr:uncharacterized protein LOC116426979 [Nomia melanderi]
MIKIIVLLLGICEVLAVPETPWSPDISPGMVSPQLPGSENLNEKVLPLSKLILREPPGFPGEGNTVEKIQMPSELPGTKNLAEKSIPFLVLEKLSRPLEFGTEN